MLRQGNSPKVVQEIAGHHSSAYTMDTYCWSDRRTQRAAADSIGDLFSSALGAMEIKSGDKSGDKSKAVLERPGLHVGSFIQVTVSADATRAKGTRTVPHSAVGLTQLPVAWVVRS